MDENQNGKLDPDEISDRARQFMGPRLQAAGIDISQPVDLERIAEAFTQGRSNDDDDDDRSSNSGPSASDRTVPGFSSDFDLPLVPGFDIPEGSPLLDPRPYNSRYSEAVRREAEGTLSRYDSNRNEILDLDEMRRVRWQDPPWTESDLDNDGRLTKIELAERYQKRQGEQSERRESERDRWHGRGDDDDDDNERGGWQGRSGWQGRGGGDDNSRSGWQGRSGWSNRGNDDDDDDDRRERSEREQVSTDERFARYADGLIRRYDENDDGILQKDEWEKIRGEWSNADSDGDSEITADELVGKFKRDAGQDDDDDDRDSSPSRRSSSRDRSSSDQKPYGNRVFISTDDDNGDVYRSRSVSEHLEEMGVGSDFTRMDRNVDGQVQMAEYITNWSVETMEAFRARDLNDDGVITPVEWMNSGSSSRRGR